MKRITVSVLILAIFAFIQTTLAAEQTKKPEQYLTEVEGPACPLCTLLVGKVRDAAEQYEGRVTEEFKKLVCNKLPDATQELCKDFVDDYGPRVIDALLKKIDPDAVCEKIGLCDDAAWFRRYVTDKQAYLITVELEEMGVTNDNCAMCKYIVGEVEQYANSSREVLEHELLHACEALPGSLQQMCDTVVLLYGPQILDYILKYETPEVLCQQIGLCAKKVEQFQKDLASNDACPTCKFVVGFVEDYLEKNETIEKIEERVHDLCQLLPPEYSSMCIGLVDQYLPQFIHYLEQKYTPEQVCELIGLCGDSKQAPVVEDEDNDGKCELCKYVLELAEDYLKGEKTEEKIKEALHQVCEKFPPISGACTAFVDKYEPMLVQFLLNEFPPAQACEKIHLCQSQQQINDESNDACPTCKFVVGFVEDYLEKNATEEKIEEAAHDLCHLLPPQYSSTCIGLVDQYLPQFIHYLEQKYTPEQVCKMIGLCDEGKTTGAAFAKPTPEQPTVVRMNTN